MGGFGTFDIGPMVSNAMSLRRLQQNERLLDQRDMATQAQTQQQNRLLSLQAAAVSGDQDAQRALASIDPDLGKAVLSYREAESAPARKVASERREEIERLKDESFSMAATRGVPGALESLAVRNPDRANALRPLIQEQLTQYANIAQRVRALPMERRAQFAQQAIAQLPNGVFKQSVEAGLRDGRITDEEVSQFEAMLAGTGKAVADPDAFQQEVQRLMQANPGLTPDRAANIALGVERVSRNPVSGQLDRVNAVSGSVQPLASGPDDLSLPADDFRNPLAPEGERSLAEGTGTLQQAVQGLANSAAQFLGADPVYPSQLDSSTAVTNLARDTALALSSAGADGRTSNLRYEQFLQTQAQPFLGEATARARVRETIDQLTSRIREAEAFANEPTTDRSIRRIAVQQIGELRRLRQRWADLVTGDQRAADGMQTTPGGARFRVVE